MSVLKAGSDETLRASASQRLTLFTNRNDDQERSDLDQRAGRSTSNYARMQWAPIATAPFDRDLELAVLDEDGVHALVFPCRRILGGWLNARSRLRIEVRPTHWREWEQTT